MGEGQASPFIHPYIHPSPTHTRAISASWTEHDRVGNLLDGDPSAMLMSRPDAAALLEVLDFHPPDWRQYYRKLFDRFPNLAGRWINVNLWNMPERYPVDQWSIDDDARMREAARARQHADSRMLSEIRALALAITYRSGTARLQAQRKLDRRLAEFGLRPQFPGGSRLPASERRKVRETYEELRTVIDEVRNAEREGVGELFRRAIFIKFPFFTDEEMAMIYAHPYPRRGATADAALAILAQRLVMSPASLSRYLFPRRHRK